MKKQIKSLLIVLSLSIVAAGTTAYLCYLASASFDGNNGVIVQTGGSTSWKDPSVSANSTSRFYFGKDVDVHYDEGGVYSSNFKGRWVYINGQPLEVYYIDSESENLHIFSGLVLVNDELVNLRFSYNSLTAEMNIQGIWKGGLEDGQYGRLTSLQKGDVICPIYEYIVEQEGSFAKLGEEFIYENDDILDILPLKSNLFMYYFEIEDIFGQTYHSKSAVFQMKYSYEELLENPLTGKYDFAADILLIANNSD